MSDRRRRFVGLKDLIHDNVRQGLSAGLTALGDLVKPAKQLLEDEPIITLQCGKVVMESTPRRMRTELWMSSLHRKGVGVAAAEKYEDMLMHKSISDEAASDIDKDLARTFPSMRRFASQEGQEALRRVLLAYAAYDPEVGYCQGMNFVAGLLLMYLPERHAFGGLVVLMQDRGLRKYYSTDMSLLQTHLWQLGRLMPQKLCAHLEACGVLPLLYGASWLMTCFSADFPASFSARVMDVIMADKMDQALLKAAVCLLKRCEQQLLRLRDMEDILQLLKLQLPNWEEPLLHDILTDAFKAPWSSQQLQLLGSTEGAESVAEALERVHRANNQTPEPAAAGGGTSPTSASPTAAATRAGRVSTSGSTGDDSVDGASPGSSRGGTAAVAAAIRLMPPPSPRPLSRNPTQRGFGSDRAYGSEQGHGGSDLGSEPNRGSGSGLADLLGAEHTADHSSHGGSSIGSAAGLRVESPGASLAVLALPGHNAAATHSGSNSSSNGLLLIDMSSPRASLQPPAAAQALAEGLQRGGSDWASFVEAPAAAPKAQPVSADGWDPFGMPVGQPSSRNASSSLPAVAAAPAAADGPGFSSNSDSSRSQLNQVHKQPHQQQVDHHQHQQQQQQQQHIKYRFLRQQLGDLSFSQLSSGQESFQQHHQHSQSKQQQQLQQPEQRQRGWQPSVQRVGGSNNKPSIEAASPKQVTADDDWWDFQSSPLGQQHTKQQQQQQQSQRLG